MRRNNTWEWGSQGKTDMLFWTLYLFMSTLFFFHILKLILVCVMCVRVTNLQQSVLSKWVTEIELRSSVLAVSHLTSILDILFTQQNKLWFSSIFFLRKISLSWAAYKTDVIQEAKEGLRLTCITECNSTSKKKRTKKRRKRREKFKWQMTTAYKFILPYSHHAPPPELWRLNKCE